MFPSPYLILTIITIVLASTPSTITAFAMMMMPSNMLQHSPCCSTTTVLFYRDPFTEEHQAPPVAETARNLRDNNNKKPKKNSSIWLELTVLEKAVQCAECLDACPVDDLDELANGTM